MPLWHILRLVASKRACMWSLPVVSRGRNSRRENFVAPCGRCLLSLVISGVGNFLSFQVPGECTPVPTGWLRIQAGTGEAPLPV